MEIMEPNSPKNPANRPPIMFEIWEWIKVIVIALLIAIPVRYFIAEPFVVDGASMDPTFKTGHFLIIDRLSYRFKEPKRGDVIVFRYPNNPSTFYIKRIIGLPGESISLQNGVVKINHSSTTDSLREPYIVDIHKSYDNAEFSLNKDQYFVMGDNRAESSDSRTWGPLDKKFIIGRPAFRVLPINKISTYPGEYNLN